MELEGYGVDTQLAMDPQRPTGTCVVMSRAREITPSQAGMTAAGWDQLTTALALPYQAQREAEMHIARAAPQSAVAPAATPRQ